MDKVRRLIKPILREVWCRKGFPILWPLPYGGWQILYSDPQSLSKFFLRYETRTWKYVKDVVKEGMFCLDLGANQGFYTILLAKLVGPTGKVIAFDPVHEELSRLRRNLKLNKLEESEENLKICEVLVGRNCNSREKFYVPVGAASRSSVGPIPTEVKRKRIETRWLEQISLDEYLIGCRRVDFMKIDVEGGELGVLSGADRILREDRPIIVIEVADVATREVGYEARRLLEYLEERDYEIKFLDDRDIVGRDYLRCEVAAVPRYS